MFVFGLEEKTFYQRESKAKEQSCRIWSDDGQKMVNKTLLRRRNILNKSLLGMLYGRKES